MSGLPFTLVMMTVWCYWISVVLMIIRSRMKHRTASGAVPRSRLESCMWVIWMPTVICWQVAPSMAFDSSHPMLRAPQWVIDHPQSAASWIAVLAAFSFVRLISALPVTPGGVGVVELGYAASMTIGMDDLTSAQVVAAILVFRAITYLLPIPLGLASYVIWRINRSWRMSQEERNVLVGDAYVTEEVSPA